mmetsp:Transcript_15980/g.48837  ORF Transcript_15980/g.48837 Transcript_15980/m.48837 type:complete len:780 (+) Transcript_15980:177-2516(+)
MSSLKERNLRAARLGAGALLGVAGRLVVLGAVDAHGLELELLGDVVRVLAQELGLVERHGLRHGARPHLLHDGLDVVPELHAELHLRLEAVRLVHEVVLELLDEGLREGVAVVGVVRAHPPQHLLLPREPLVGHVDGGGGLLLRRRGALALLAALGLLRRAAAEVLDGVREERLHLRDEGVLRLRRRPRRLEHGLALGEDVAPDVLGPVRAERREHDDLRLDPARDEPGVHPRAGLRRPVAVAVARELHLEEAGLERVAEFHVGAVLIAERHALVHVVGEAAVEEGPRRELRVAQRRRAAADGGDRLVDEVELRREAEDGGVGRRAREVGVLPRVAGVGAGEAHGVGGVVRNALVHHDEVALALAHLLGVHEDVAVGVHALRPHLRAVLPDLAVVEQRHGQVVRDEVLGRHAQVHGVPVLELALEVGQHVGGHVAVRRGAAGAAEEDVVPDGLGERLRRHAGGAGARALHVAGALEQVRHGVVRHVDGRVRERLDDPVLVPGEQRAEAELARARPLAEPADAVLELALHVVVVAVEAPGLHVREHLLRPLGVVVAEVPLLRERHDALVARAGHDLGVRLPVGERRAGRDHLRADLRLGVLHRRAGVGPDDHNAVGEALEVDLVLGGGELVAVVGAPHAEALAHLHGGGASVARDLDDGHDGEVHHVRLDAVPRGVVRLVLELPQRGVVVGRVRGHRRDHAGALAHADGEQRERVHRLVGRLRAVERQPEEVPALDSRHEALNLARGARGELLVHHAARGALAHDEHVAAEDLCVIGLGY